MSTEFFNDQWRIPSNENQNKVSNYSMDFNGSSDKIEVQDASNEFGFSNNSFSLSAWVFIDSVSTQNGLIAKRNIGSSSSNKMWYFEINTSSQIRFLWYTSSSSSNTSSTDTIPLNTWTHVVVTSNGAGANGLTFYINGTADSGGAKTSPSSASSIQQTGTPFWIGARGGNSSAQYTNGKIDQVSVFDYELSASQVSTLYGGGTAITNPMSLSPKPISYYQLGDQSVYNGANYLVPNNSLSGSEGYSSYALDLDGVDDYLDCGDSNTFSFGNGTADSPFSISAWINMDDATTFRIASKAGSNGNEYFLTNGGDDKLNFILYDTSGNGNIRAKYDTALTSYQGQWIHVVGTYSGVNRQNGVELYLNGSLLTTLKVLNSPYTAMSNTTQPLEIGRSASSSYANGKFSNVSVFNTELTSTQVTEIYNSGIPSDLNTFSGTAPVAWWQLGSNSSFNTNWTCLDEIGTNNAVSANMTNNDIVDGVGYSASGLGTSSIEIANDAPYSTANGLSENMDVLDRTTDIPS